jgi:hypothetical protein
MTTAILCVLTLSQQERILHSPKMRLQKRGSTKLQQRRIKLHNDIAVTG